MFFGKKKIKCKKCSSKVEDKFSFCPHCGNNLISKEKEQEDFGMLGKDDILENLPIAQSSSFEGMLGSLANSLFKQLTKQMQNNMEVHELPNGITISVGSLPRNIQKPQKPKKQAITEEQLERMSKLPRTIAKTKVRRLSNKIIYELSTPGVESVDDIFVSKIESGYEIKSLGQKRVYTTSIPINLALRKISIADNKTFVEFQS